MGQAFSIPGKLREYNQRTNYGRVFDRDLSLRSDLGVRHDNNNETLVLTEDEVRDREEWRTTKEEGFFKGSSLLLVNIGPLYFEINGSVRAEELLQLQVAAPVLHPDPSKVSNRSAIAEGRADRWYPPSLSSWDDFPVFVANFASDIVMNGGNGQKTRAWQDLSMSFFARNLIADEIGEQVYLQVHVMTGLHRAGLIGEFVNGNRGLVGSPDFWIEDNRAKKRIAIVGEAKSTHNLPLPMAAKDIVKQYNDAIASSRLDSTRAQILAWSHVGHPASQLIGYMILNRCRYGMLTSATRTYFLHIDNVDDVDIVHISDAWFIGQSGYLRAIAAMYDRARNDTKPRLSKQKRRGWTVSTPPAMKEARGQKRARDGTDPGRAHSRSTTRQTALSASGTTTTTETSLTHSLDFRSIDMVDFEEFDIREPIGYGKRGTSFSVQWKDELLAVKIFDTTKPGGQDAFEKEIKAYLHLEDAWGELVPEPRFVSFAFGMWFLGMQLAQPPPESAHMDDWANVLDELERKYKFRHLDIWNGERGDNGQNLMYIKDKEGRDRPIVIDLEDYEFL